MVCVAILACLLGSAAGSAWSDYLAGLSGNANSFDWKKACKSLGQTPAGYGMSSGGGKTTFQLTCDSNKIAVVCSGGTCSSSYQPPASSSDSPPTGIYNKKVTSTCSSGGFSSKEVQEFLNIHNKMRCAVGVPPVTWDSKLECQAQKTQNSIGAFKHSHSYDMAISAGENLATGKSVASAAWMWFTEYLQSGGDYSKFSHHTGHYTALAWKSVKTIGCGIGKGGKGVIHCMYSGGSKSAAPNMAGGFSKNLPAFKGTAADFKKCGLTAAEVKAKATLFKGWGILHPSGTEARNIGLWVIDDLLDPGSKSKNVLPANVSPAALISACAALFATAMFTIGIVMRRRSRPAATHDEKELLSIEQAECPE